MIKLPFNLNFKSLIKTSSSNNFFTIDIGSDAVKCLVFKHDESLEILGVGKEKVNRDMVRCGNVIDLQKTIEAIDNALFRAMENVEESVENVIFGLSEDIGTSIVTTVRINRADSSRPITKKEYDEITEKIVETAFENAQTKLSRKTGELETNLEIVTLTNVYAKIDDTLVKNIIGSTGRKVEVAMYTAFAPAHYLKILEEISKALDLQIKAVAPTLFSVVQTLKRIKGNEDMDAVIIDIGTDSTKVGVVFSGGVSHTNTLNVGGKHFSEAIALEKGLTFEEAEKIKKLQNSNNEEDRDEDVENALDETFNIWLDGLESLFTEFDGVKMFPTDIYVVGGGSKLPNIFKELQNTPWTKSIPFKAPPTFHKLETKDINYIKDSVGQTEDLEFFGALSLATINYELLKETNT